jgi:hypothetical protein
LTTTGYKSATASHNGSRSTPASRSRICPTRRRLRSRSRARQSAVCHPTRIAWGRARLSPHPRYPEPLDPVIKVRCTGSVMKYASVTRAESTLEVSHSECAAAFFSICLKVG